MIDQRRKILGTYKLRSTQVRSIVLDLFLNTNHALSFADIESEIAFHIDRATVYRTLKTFFVKGMIHKVLDDKGGVKYALCKEGCAGKMHHHNHVHFKCTVCAQTSCLEEVEIPFVTLPIGFKIDDMDLLVKGVCGHCS